MRTLGLLLSFGFLVACGSDNNNGQMDAALDFAGPSDMAACPAGPQSQCGHPCDKGNSLGVGQFCMTISDCGGNTRATFCSAIVNSGGPGDTYICTFICDPAAASPCGENAFCGCQGGQCGCVPNRCGGGGS